MRSTISTVILLTFLCLSSGVALANMYETPVVHSSGIVNGRFFGVTSDKGYIRDAQTNSPLLSKNPTAVIGRPSEVIAEGGAYLLESTPTTPIESYIYTDGWQGPALYWFNHLKWIFGSLLAVLTFSLFPFAASIFGLNHSSRLLASFLGFTVGIVVFSTSGTNFWKPSETIQRRCDSTMPAK